MKELPENIGLAVREIKSAIVKAQSRVAANANAEMLALYFGIGQYVSRKTATEKWGAGVIDAISRRLQQEMPGLRGFSGKSIRTMRQFYEKWAEALIWPPAAAKLELDAKDGVICSPAVSKSGNKEVVRMSWPLAAAKLKASGGLSITADEFLALSFSHHMEILSGTDTLEERFFYIHAAASRSEITASPLASRHTARRRKCLKNCARRFPQLANWKSGWEAENEIGRSSFALEAETK